MGYGSFDDGVLVRPSFFPTPPLPDEATRDSGLRSLIAFPLPLTSLFFLRRRYGIVPLFDA